MYRQDYVDRYNAALDEARAKIAALGDDATPDDVNKILKSLFTPLIVEDLKGDAFARPTLMDRVRVGTRRARP